jgi:peptidoglycan/LPS O-acetylase OafA/YrhL
MAAGAPRGAEGARGNAGPAVASGSAHRGDRMNRIRGLDSIRAVLALWVAMNHVIKPPFPSFLDTTVGVGRWLKAVYDLSINGQAAVIGFFVISGFCVHLPYRRHGPTNLAAYYLRRDIRVGIPFVLVLVLTRFLPDEYAVLERGIFWSVYAELIYYTLYPFIFRLRQRLGWNALIVLTFVSAPLVLFAGHDGGNYHAVGDSLAWILGLPCWLLGCKLAEDFDRPGRAVGRAQIWSWRFAVWAASVFCFFLRFHTPIEHCYSLNFFAILVYFWIEREIRYFMGVAPLGFLEDAGGWSYSLYLTHFFGIVLFASYAPQSGAPYLDWLIKCGFVLGTAYAYSRIVEAPAHALARRLAQRVSRATQSADKSSAITTERPTLPHPSLTAVSPEEP